MQTQKEIIFRPLALDGMGQRVEVADEAIRIGSKMKLLKTLIAGQGR